MSNPATVLEDVTYKLPWDLDIQTDHQISARRPDLVSKLKLAILVEGDLKAPFSIVITPRLGGKRYSFPWIAPLYP